MKGMAFAIALWLLGALGASAQNVTVIGPITPGDCARFNSTTVIKDAGFDCTGAPAVPFANPTGAVGLTAVNGVATSAMRSDAAPPLSSSVQSALTGTGNGLLFGTGAFGFSSTPAATTNGSVAYFNGSTWVILAGNNAGTKTLTEDSSGNPSWSASGAGSVTEQKNTASGGLVTSGNCDNTTTNAASPCNYALTAGRQTLPTTQTLTSGTGATYTTPANCLWIEVWIVGGGGGGAGTNTTVNNFVAGSDGTASTFNSVNANPGKGTAASVVPGAGGTGGTGTATRRAPGTPGNTGLSTSTISAFLTGSGGNSQFAHGGAIGVAAGITVGNAGAANTGGGGSGASNNGGTNVNLAPGGGGGETAYLIINNPAATYTYTIGPGGAGGSSTTNGGAGGSGVIFVVEHYGS